MLHTCMLSTVTAVAHQYLVTSPLVNINISVSVTTSVTSFLLLLLRVHEYFYNLAILVAISRFPLYSLILHFPIKVYVYINKLTHLYFYTEI